MIRKKKNSRVYEVDFSKRERNIKKTIAILLQILVILGYVFYIGYNIIIPWSALEIRINPGEFSETIVDNETIIFGGVFEIDNDHWNSMDIRDLSINITFSLTNGTSLLDYSFEKDIIPAREKTDIEIEIPIGITMFGFELLNSSLELELDLDIEVSFWYCLTGLSFSIKSTIEVM